MVFFFEGGPLLDREVSACLRFWGWRGWAIFVLLVSVLVFRELRKSSKIKLGRIYIRIICRAVTPDLG